MTLFPRSQTWKRNYLRDALSPYVMGYMLADAQLRADRLLEHWLDCFGRSILKTCTKSFLCRSVITIFAWLNVDLYSSVNVCKIATLAVYFVRVGGFRRPGCGMMLQCLLDIPMFIRAVQTYIAHCKLYNQEP